MNIAMNRGLRRSQTAATKPAEKTEDEDEHEEDGRKSNMLCYVHSCGYDGRPPAFVRLRRGERTWPRGKSNILLCGTPYRLWYANIGQMSDAPTKSASDIGESISPRVMARPELLAPAGDWECARAAVENGADAIYFGLEKFNARMRAQNFTEAELPGLMEFLHRRGLKRYVHVQYADLRR